MPTLYGIPNCDTVRKARKWLDANGVAVAFVDFKKTPPSNTLIHGWLESVDWEVLLNKRSTTWRGLADADKTDINKIKAVDLMVANPSLIKRPVLVTETTVLVGFSETAYQALTT